MSFQEKSTWLQAVATIVVWVAYAGSILGQVRSRPVAEIDYQGQMLATIGIAIGLLIVAHIAIAMAAPKEADKTDQRDTDINRFGEYIGSFVLWFGALGVLAMALAELEHFWIANAIFTVFMLASTTR